MDILEMFNLVNTLKICVILMFILTVTTEIGFIIQKSYVDIRIIALCAIISILVCIIIAAKSIPIACFVSYLLFLGLLSKFGEVEVMPDAIFATVIGVGIEAFILTKYTSIFLNY